MHFSTTPIVVASGPCKQMSSSCRGIRGTSVSCRCARAHLCVCMCLPTDDIVECIKRSACMQSSTFQECLKASEDVSLVLLHRRVAVCGARAAVGAVWRCSMRRILGFVLSHKKISFATAQVLGSECYQLRLLYFECKRGQLDMRNRMRGKVALQFSPAKRARRQSRLSPQAQQSQGARARRVVAPSVCWRACHPAPPAVVPVVVST